MTVHDQTYTAVPTPIVPFVMPLTNEQKILAVLERIEVLLTTIVAQTAKPEVSMSQFVNKAEQARVPSGIVNGSKGKR